MADDTRLVRRETTVWANGQTPEESLTVVTPDQAVQYRREAGATHGWTQTARHVSWQRATWQQPVHYVGDYYNLLFGDVVYRLVVQPYIGRGPNAYRPPLLLEDALRVVRRPPPGPDRIEVTERIGGPSGREFVYSLRDDWLVTRFLSRTTPPAPGVEPTPADDHVAEVRYGPVVGDRLPYPTKVRGRRLRPGQPGALTEEVEFREYRADRPAAGKLDVEARLGLTLPDPGVRPPLTPRWRYLQDPPQAAPIPQPKLPPPPATTNPAALCVLLAMTAGASLLAWRRRR